MDEVKRPCREMGRLLNDAIERCIEVTCATVCLVGEDLLFIGHRSRQSPIL